jgi:hypothetical protein
MRTSTLHAVLVALVGVACSDATSAPVATWTANLNVANEVPAPTGTSTLAGTATVTIAGGGTAAGTITYSITLTGTPNAGGTITAAHIHTAAAGVGGGPVRVNLCGTGSPAPACPTGAGSVASTTVTYASGSAAVLNTPAMTFDGLVTALRAYGAYVNVHTTTNTGGEIRGQLLPPPQ